MQQFNLPPYVIRPLGRPNKVYTCIGLLGKEAFGTCIKVQDQDNKIFALKTIEKANLGQNRDEIRNEMTIHMRMAHPHIVKFYDVFDNQENSLKRMLRNRGRLTEPEIRYFLNQLLDATEYMHKNNVIHRDLKPDNIFLSSDMKVKIGDFGHVCGTLSFIVPEMLDLDSNDGYSFKIDIWAIEVIMYQLLFDRLPFSGTDQSTIIDRILDCDYEFPDDVDASDNAKDLIDLLLTTNPARPTIPQIR
ncbi:hypothetical protein Glove_33g297 [Diversispora epigaea]|uniref:Protein kinase domain-containing protein n=1 Tax=Diversispora epigaea TaxID=1348612 RepID=A0A397JLA0_9GLOM|nr:hypothetical protein Glove_33g297 [Diversispora epigaea]